MARKTTQTEKEIEKSENILQMPTDKKENKNDRMDELNRMLAAVLEYLSDDQVEEIDLEYLLETTEGLREWWEQYREKNRKKIEEEIKLGLEGLSLKELENIREQIKGKKEEEA